MKKNQGPMRFGFQLQDQLNFYTGSFNSSVKMNLHDQVSFIRLSQVIKINILLRIKLILYYLQNSFLSDRL